MLGNNEDVLDDAPEVTVPPYERWHSWWLLDCAMREVGAEAMDPAKADALANRCRRGQVLKAYGFMPHDGPTILDVGPPDLPMFLMGGSIPMSMLGHRKTTLGRVPAPLRANVEEAVSRLYQSGLLPEIYMVPKLDGKFLAQATLVRNGQAFDLGAGHAVVTDAGYPGDERDDVEFLVIPHEVNSDFTGVPVIDIRTEKLLQTYEHIRHSPDMAGVPLKVALETVHDEVASWMTRISWDGLDLDAMKSLDYAHDIVRSCGVVPKGRIGEWDRAFLRLEFREPGQVSAPHTEMYVAGPIDKLNRIAVAANKVGQAGFTTCIKAALYQSRLCYHLAKTMDLPLVGAVETCRIPLVASEIPPVALCERAIAEEASMWTRLRTLDVSIAGHEHTHGEFCHREPDPAGVPHGYVPDLPVPAEWIEERAELAAILAERGINVPPSLETNPRWAGLDYRRTGGVIETLAVSRDRYFQDRAADIRWAMACKKAEDSPIPPSWSSELAEIEQWAKYSSITGADLVETDIPDMDALGGIASKELAAPKPQGPVPG